jgi:hypothetical protein
LLTACGGNGSSASGPATTTTNAVAAKTWVGAVCRDTLDWVDYAKQQSQSFATIVQNAPSLQAAKTGVMSFFDSLITRTESYLSQLRAAGTPAVSGGPAISRSIARGIQQIDDAYRQAKAKAAALSTADATTFSDQLTAIGADLNAASSGVDRTLGALASSELEAASRDVAACQQLQSASSPGS